MGFLFVFGRGVYFILLFVWLLLFVKGVLALHLPTGPLKISSGLEPVPRCEPSTYQPISR